MAKQLMEARSSIATGGSATTLIDQTLDYANTMLSRYENDEPLNIEAISHYRQLAADEQKRLERLERLENKE